MAYEGIALIQEKQAVVLDLGSEYTKFGFTGEAAPRCIVRSEFWDPTRRAMRRLHDYSTPEELYDNLVHMLHLLYFRHVLVNPKERKVVVVESLLTPTIFRETLAKVLFTHYEVSGAVWADSPRMCAATLGAPVVLVVMVGAQEVEVTAVVHGCVVLSTLEAQPLGARALHQELLRLLREDQPDLELSDQVLEDIKVKTCFVTTRARALQWRSGRPPAEARGVTWRAAGGGGGGGVRVSGRARELAAEAMFARDAERAALPDAVLRAARAAPRDVRRALLANLLVVGGGAALPGLLPRLRDELAALLDEEPYRSQLFATSLAFHRAPAPPSCAAWCGGAAAGAALGSRALAREHYTRAPRLPDWACLLDNTPPDHPHRRLVDM